jgi:hypothetical protein
VVRILAEAELMHPHLSSLERLVTAAHLSSAVDASATELGVPWTSALDLVAMVAFGNAASCCGSVMWNRAGARIPATFAVRLALEHAEDESARTAWTSAVEMVCSWASRHARKRKPPLSTDAASALVRDIVSCASTRLLCIDTSAGRQGISLAKPSDWLSGEDGLLYSSDVAQQVALQCGYVATKHREREVTTFKMRTTDGEWCAPREPAFLASLCVSPATFSMQSRAPAARLTSRVRARRDEEDGDGFLCETYLRGAIGTLVYYANACSFAKSLLSQKGKKEREMRAQLGPIQRVASEAELMPLWPILQSLCAADAGERHGRHDGRPQLSMVVIVALHVCLVSVREVRGSTRCKQLAKATRRSLKAMAAQLERARHTDPRATGDNFGDAHLWYACGWMKMTNLNLSSSAVTGASAAQQAQADRLRDHALLCTPWVAGQTLLVATLGIGIGIGSIYFNAMRQASLVLRLHHGFQRAGLLDSLVRRCFTPRPLCFTPCPFCRLPHQPRPIMMSPLSAGCVGAADVGAAFGDARYPT